jgi:hypothetical protein
MNKGHRPSSQVSGLFHNDRNVVPESIGLGINFACLSLKGVDELIPSACVQINHSIADKNSSALFDKDKIEAQEKAEVAKYISGLSKLFLFKVELATLPPNETQGLMGAVEFSATPVCLRPKEMWPNDSKIEKRKASHSSVDEYLTMSTRSEILEVSISTDQFLRAKVDMHASTNIFRSQSDGAQSKRGPTDVVEKFRTAGCLKSQLSFGTFCKCYEPFCQTEWLTMHLSRGIRIATLGIVNS